MKIENTQNTPSFDINDYIKSVKEKNKNISFTELDKIINDIPIQLQQRNAHLRLIADWFIKDLITPYLKIAIKEYIQRAIKTNTGSPNEFKALIERQFKFSK